MKKGLIKEAFRLQQIAGIAPVNEIFDTDNDQYLGKYSDAYSRITVSNDGEYTAKDPSDEEAVRLADALTALYDEHGENGIDAWQAGAIDIEDFMDNINEMFDNDNPDALRLGDDVIRRYFETMVESQPDTVVNILTQLLTNELSFEQFTKVTVADIEDSYQDEL